jgi:hypothetical protein
MELDRLEFLRWGRTQGSIALDTDPGIDRIDLDIGLDIDLDTDRVDLGTDPKTDRIDLDTDRVDLGTDPKTDRIDLDTDPKTDRIDLDTGLDVDHTGKSKWYKPFSKTSISSLDSVCFANKS